ncbi:MAG: cation-transporting P-type ATPase [Candidatus Binataceae bacterium]
MIEQSPAPSPAAQGLSPAQARQCLLAFGSNRVARQSLLERFKEAIIPLADPMALMLAAASAVYFALGESTETIILYGAWSWDSR